MKNRTVCRTKCFKARAHRYLPRSWEFICMICPFNRPHATISIYGMHKTVRLVLVRCSTQKQHRIGNCECEKIVLYLTLACMARETILWLRQIDRYVSIRIQYLLSTSNFYSGWIIYYYYLSNIEMEEKVNQKKKDEQEEWKTLMEQSVNRGKEMLAINWFTLN